jgi:hypothetical protein
VREELLVNETDRWAAGTRNNLEHWKKLRELATMCHHYGPGNDEGEPNAHADVGIRQYLRL